jgi:hypothetical protein
VGRKRLKNNITLKNIWYSYPYRYTQKSSHYVTQSQFRNIAKDFFKLLSEEMINSAYEYKLPHRLGILRVKKFKGLKRQVDWGLTNKHYKEENATKPSGSKSFVYHNNKHSAGYTARWWWTMNKWVKYNQIFSFVATRSNKRLLAQSIKNDNVIIKYKE